MTADHGGPPCAALPRLGEVIEADQLARGFRPDFNDAAFPTGSITTVEVRELLRRYEARLREQIAREIMQIRNDNTIPTWYAGVRQSARIALGAT